MPLFACTGCGSVDNTALSGYWAQQMDAHEAATPFAPKCCHCHSGFWHGKFPRKSAAGYSIDNHGFIWSPEEIAAGKLPDNFTITGTVPFEEAKDAEAPTKAGG